MTISEPLLIGIDLGGTTLRVGLVRGRQVIKEYRVKADLCARCAQSAPKEALDSVISSLSEGITSIQQSFDEKIDAIGVSVPGYVEAQTGIILSSPNLPGLINADIAAPLSERFATDVWVENDALAATWGEYILHPERPDSMIYIGLGTGIGGGLIIDCRPYRGTHGMAMEIGHLVVEPGGRPCGCGKHGCIEQYASATGISLSFAQHDGKQQDADKIACLAEAGDPYALACFKTAGLALGQAVTHLVKILDVTEIVMGGGVSRSWQKIERHFYGQLDSDLFEPLRSQVKIRLSEALDQAGMLGAALLANRRYNL